MRGSRTPAECQQQWFFCSELVLIQWPGGVGDAVSAILEEIGPDGAVVQLEAEVAPRTSLTLVCEGTQFDGVVRRCRKEPPLGYFTEIDFAPGQQWSADLFRPSHLLNVTIPGPRAAGHDFRDFARDQCWADCMAPADAVPQAAFETIRRVAQNLAVVCGEMDLLEMAQCFSRFFRQEPQGAMFGGFVSAYRNARESLAGLYEMPVSPLRQVSQIAGLLGAMPEGAVR
jgi:hypothetical protein